MTLADNHIKINLGGESVWALQISETTAKIDNVPLTGGYGLGDLVEYNPRTGMVERVIDRASWTSAIRYDRSGERSAIQERFSRICKYLRSHEICFEGARPGMALISVPRDMNEEQLREVLVGCPEPIELVTDGEEEDDDNIGLNDII